MKLIERIELPPNSGASVRAPAGSIVRVTGRTVIDLVAFDLADLQHRFDQARTKSNHARIFIGQGDILYSKRNQPMLTIVDDTFAGRHDLQKGMCSRERFRLVAEGKAFRRYADGVDRNPQSLTTAPDHGCWENLQSAVTGYPIPADDIPSPFNIFQNMRIDSETGDMFDDLIALDQPAHMDLRAEMDLLVAISACPQSGRGEGATLEVWEP